MFSDVLSVEDLTKSTKSLSSVLANKYQVGTFVTVTYKNGRFYQNVPNKVHNFTKGDLAIVRFVKAVSGYGVTVQLSEKTFGMIELCELTDEVTSNVTQLFQNKGVFVARVIDTDKKGRLMLSARDSVVDAKSWELIKPSGTTAAFQQADAKNQAHGNFRNRILKFGVASTFKTGDLTIGYVTNISKAGCFISVGHGVSMRAGLNELSDQQDYDFMKQMPIGRIVLARITKSEQNNTRFNCSLRLSLIQYGVHQVSKNALTSGQIISALVLAQSADGNAFAQLKGSYLKLKVKNTPGSVKVGSLIEVEL